jgi:hypothetical protein
VSAGSAWLAVLRAGAIVLLGNTVFLHARDLWVFDHTVAQTPTSGGASRSFPLHWHIGAAIESISWLLLLRFAPAMTRVGGPAEARLSTESALSLVHVAIGSWCVIRAARALVGHAVFKLDPIETWPFAAPREGATSAALQLALGIVLFLIGAGPRTKRLIRRWVLAPTPEELGVVRDVPR